MARILLDGRKFCDFGIGRYLRHLWQDCPEHDQTRGHIWGCLSTPGDQKKLRALAPEAEVLVSQTKPYSLEEAFLFASDAARFQPDLTHFPHYVTPLRWPGKVVVSIHDLIHLAFPEFYPLHKRLYAWLMLRHAVRRADAIITGAEFVKRDLIKRLHCPAEKIHVIQHGIDHETFCPRSDDETGRVSTEPYFLHVGNLLSHKNVAMLLEAFQVFREEGHTAQLVFAGGSFSAFPDLLETVEQHPYRQDIWDTGFVSETELVDLYRDAIGLVFPSFYEGFGLPAVEAMACGTPVIASSEGALPETCGGAAILADPRQPEVWAEAMCQLLRSDEVQGKLTEKGLRRASELTWEKTAQRTYDVYQRILET